MQSQMVNGRWKGNRCTFGSLEFWPERGMINILDTDTKQHEVITVRVALQRLQAIVHGAKRTAWPFDRKRMLDFADHMMRCCKIAKSQGDPFDMDILKNRRPVHLKPIHLPVLVDKYGKTYFDGPIMH